MYTKEFKVVAKSQNTNSFGLFQMIVVAKDGEAYKTHASQYNAKEQGESVYQKYSIDPKTEKKRNAYFSGHEMTTKIDDCPKNVVKEIWGNSK